MLNVRIYRRLTYSSRVVVVELVNKVVVKARVEGTERGGQIVQNHCRAEFLLMPVACTVAVAGGADVMSVKAQLESR